MRFPPVARNKYIIGLPSDNTVLHFQQTPLLSVWRKNERLSDLHILFPDENAVWTATHILILLFARDFRF